MAVAEKRGGGGGRPPGPFDAMCLLHFNIQKSFGGNRCLWGGGGK